MRSYAHRILTLLLTGLLGSAPSLRAEDEMERLPRESFDVIPPSERVLGERGRIAVYQNLCRIGPTKDARRRIVDVAVQEWAYFGFQTIDATKIETQLLPGGLVPDAANPKLASPRIARQFPKLGQLEYDDRLDTTIAGYWSATPDGARVINQQNRAWASPGGNAVNWVQPWSAAFVSWEMCEAGLGDMVQFERSIAHRNYIDQAIAARDGTAPQAAYEAHDAGEVAIEPGDLLCNSRGSTDYRNLEDRRMDVGQFAPTHCDIVVKMDDARDRILVIGGNVVQSVSLTILPSRREGSAYPRPIDESIVDGARTVFAHLKLRADPVEPNALDNSPTIKALSARP